MISENEVPGLRVERRLDPMTGHVEIRYFWHGAPVPKVEISGAAAERLSGLTLIQKDLGNALKWIEAAAGLADQIPRENGALFVRAENRDIADEMKALFVAALVFYGKAFTEAPGRRAQMSRHWLDKEFRELHDLFLQYRHNMAAHSGAEKLEAATTYIVLLPTLEAEPDLRLATNRVQPDLVWGEEVTERFSTLITHAMAKVAEQYEKAANRILDVASKKGLAFWTEAAAQGRAVDIDKLAKTRGR